MSEDCQLQWLATQLSTRQHAIRGCRALCARLFLLVPLLAAAGSGLAAEDPNIPEVVIQAQRQAADEQITRQVQKAITEDPWIFSEHVTVTTQNGVVRVEGIVHDPGELFRILRLARKIPGTRRVVDAMEILYNDADGG